MKNKRFRKTLSAVLSAALMLQSGIVGAAEEQSGTAQVMSVNGDEAAAQSEAARQVAQSEAESEAARIAAEQAAQSEAESEAARLAAEQAAQSEAESEAARIAAEQAAQSEAESEAARLAAEQAAQSEAESEAARLAAEQAAQSEAESEAARLAAEQAAQSEAESEAARLAAEQAAQSEKQTEAQTSKENETEASSAETEKKKKKEKKEKETETERSGYENAGEKMSAKDAATELRHASLYLFAAKSLTADEQLLEGMAVAVEEEGTAIVKELEAFSLEMADAKASADLEVINLYADEDGKLDEAQLEALAEDKVIDVSSKYVLVNIIANEADQDLSFAGYDMILSEMPVEYVSGGQPCDIIYNFAAWDDGAFVGYEGTVTLARDGGLQGIFIAPEAEVKVNSDLAGSVYAENITVSETVEELLKLTFAQSTEAVETETVTEKQSESVAEAVTEAESEIETETVTGAVSEIETETVTEAVSEAETVTEAESEIETETVTEAVSEAETIIEAESEIVTEDDTEAATENETSTEILDDALLEEELIVENSAAELMETEETQTETNALMPADIAESAVITVVAEDEKTALDGAVFVIRDKDGKVVSTATADGQLQEFVRYDGVPVTLYGLADGEYVLSQIGASTGKFHEDGTVTDGEYQISEDISFRVSAAEGAAISLLIVNRAVPSGGKKLTVSAQSYYSTTAENADIKTNVLLTAEADKSYYFAVFTKDTDAVKRISAVQKLTIPAGQTDSSAAVQPDQSTADGSAVSQTGYARAVLSGLSDGTYYLATTDAFGNLLNPANISYRLQETDAAAKMTMTPVVIGAQDTEKNAVLQFVYQNGRYPEAEFSYMADVNLAVNVIDKDGKALAVDETFYASIYSDESLTTAVTDTPVEINLENTPEAAGVYRLKMTAAESTYYVAEVHADGTLITPESGFAYAVTYPGNETGTFTVSCGQTSQVEIQNKLNDSIVKIGVTNASNGKYLSGAVLAIKNSSGRVIAVNNAKTFESGAQAIELTNLLEDGSQYYLSEIQAPEGYAPSPDVKFTVKKGQTTEVVISNTPAANTDYQLTVSKQIYFGDKQVYGYDTTNKTYAKAGAYTFYAALFSDAKHTKKVSDVQKITVSGFNGTTTFKNLESGKTYYLAETTQYGEVYKSSTSTRTIKYTNSGKIAISKKGQSAIIQNVYVYEKLSDTMKKAYRYTGTLTITKKVVDTSGAALAVNGTFYAGIYRKADYSDQPTIVKLELKNASSASVKRRILLSGGSDMTYYIAELDASGNRITDETEFSYAVSLDKTEAVVSKGADTAVTITNKVKSSKATLYITKKVYEGTKLKAVNETFYAGLFKDAEFKELYTNPVPLKLENKSELTLKLSLNLGKASKATIYIAEVDKDGKVIKNQRDFGYEVRIINSTAAFTQDKLEIQTVLVNSVYGSASTSDWDDIYQNEVNNSSDGSYSSYGDLDGSTFSSNGVFSGTESGVATGDNTPVAWYVVLLGLSMTVFAGAIYRRRRRAK